MSRRPARRLSTTVLVVLALLFAQLALASYACPSVADPAQDMVAMEMAPGQPCEGTGMAMDPGQPVLCHLHCVDAPQSFDPLNVPAVSLPAVVQVLVLPPMLEAGANASARFARAGELRPPPDPLFLSTLRLRV